MTAVTDKDGNLVVMEDPWANASTDSHKLLQSWQAFNSAAGSTILDMTVFRSVPQNDTPESSRSGGSELFSELSDGVSLDIGLPDVFDDGWDPFGAYGLSEIYPVLDTNAFEFPQDGNVEDLEFIASVCSMNAASLPQAQRHSESWLPGVSGPTHRNSEIQMVPESQTSTSICGDSSAGFETDSTWSGEESDWGEDVPQIYDHLGLLMQDMGNPDLSIRPLLTPMKQELVNCIMREFWIIFNQEWSTNIQKHSGGSPQSTSSAISQHNNKSGKSCTSRGQKRERKDDEDENSEDNNGRNPKRPKVDSSPPNGADERTKFACPYRKHDRRKYCHQTRHWRSCALTPLDTIARVKLVFHYSNIKTLTNIFQRSPVSLPSNISVSPM
jgi:hypothetical protein